MGVRRGIYESLKWRLAKELPWLRLIDLDKGQVGRGERNYPVPLPAAYIRVGRIDWESRTGIQEGDATVSVALVLEHVQDTYDGAEAEEEELLEELELEEELLLELEELEELLELLLDEEELTPTPHSPSSVHASPGGVVLVQ